MFDSSIFKKFKLNRNDMKKILRKFPRYRYSYLDNDFENKKLLEVPIIKLSCELCKKYVSTIITRHPDRDTLLYERYTQFQVICYECYYKKLKPKNENVTLESLQKDIKDLKETITNKDKLIEIIFPTATIESQVMAFLGIGEERRRKYYLNEKKQAWYNLLKVTKNELEIIREKGISFSVFSEFGIRIP